MNNVMNSVMNEEALRVKRNLPELPRSEHHVCSRGMGSFILVKLSGSNSAVECDLAKVEVAGSIPVSRSSFLEPRIGEGSSFLRAFCVLINMCCLC
jgi:hypothetical protein